MTAIVGVLCKQGVVIGADSSATLGQTGYQTIEQPIEKIEIIDNKVIVACTGAVGLSQRFNFIINNYIKSENPPLRQPAWSIVKSWCSSAISDFRSTYADKNGEVPLGALVAFPADNKPRLCEFALGSFQPELRDEKIWFSSMGCTQYLTDSFLAFMRDIFWCDDQPNIQGGILAVTWTLDHAIEVNVGGVKDPISIAILEYSEKNELNARKLDEKERDEHLEFIKHLKKEYKKIYQTLQDEGNLKAPKLPEL
jgi:hypothetical protein